MSRTLKILSAVCGIIALVFTAACSSSAPKEPATKRELRLILEKQLSKEKSEDKVLEILFDDYDGDGNNEAFAVTGGDAEAKMNQVAGKTLNEGAFWFVSRNGAVSLREKVSAAEAKKLETEKNTYCVFEEYQKDSSRSFVWRVKNGEPAEEKLSGKVGGVEMTDNGITALLYSEDGMYFEEEGKPYRYSATEKPYYFFDDGEGIKEYGGIEITVEDFLKFDGAKEIIDEIKEKDNKITALYYRENGLVNINYRREAEDEYICGNSTVKLNGDSAEKYRSHKGEYAASVTDDAVYPESLPTVS